MVCKRAHTACNLCVKIQYLFYRAIGGEVSPDGDFYIFENNRYNHKGLLFKNFAMSAIVSIISENL